ncbi:putative metal-binding motif-containing protein [Myxococcus sp. RHSTA-1-4]|uniref:putative metal-binding motif-containing protein n=1 Tax=Myxococcus sp. RHSTA-1-4 TaxID=2874601 RepID=UPI001CBC9D49|nr:putative metal-binding motif-containing protein [Myxococcus sp. RHSTA-1-4]
MRHIALSVLSLLVLACNKEEQAGVKVLVEYTSSFKKGCIAVKVFDAASPEVELESKVVTNLDQQEPPLAVAVVRKEGWGPQLRLRVTAHEQTCEGRLVDEEQVDLDLSGTGKKPDQRVALVTPDADGDGYVATEQGGNGGGTDCDDSAETGAQTYLGATEVCDGRDNDCDTQVDEGLALVDVYLDEDGDGVGAGNARQNCGPIPGYAAMDGDCDDGDPDRMPGKQEVCDDKDNNCAGGVDEEFEKRWYRDADGDGAQDETTLVTQCASPGADYTQRNAQAFDCADNDPVRTPGKAELCDGVDNNCANGIDETFANKGNVCTNDVCSGRFICNTAQNGTVCDAPAPVSYHPDVDGDGQGASGSAGTKVCAPTAPPAGTVANATDCDDVDPGAKLGGNEVCDAVDNNCSGAADEGLSCGGSLKKVVDFYIGPGHDLRTVAVGASGLPVWIAGMGGKILLRDAVGAALKSFSYDATAPDPNNCGNVDWHAAWVGSNGHVYLGGAGGKLAEHTGAACINQVTASNTATITGIVGVESGGTTTLYFVNDNGRLFTWVPGNAPVQRDDTGSVYNGIHALDSSLFLVAGRASSNQRIYAYQGADLTTAVEHGLSSTSVANNMNAVWMGASNQAYAVGDGGAVWRWNGLPNAGASWTLQTPPPGVTANFSSVVMLPNNDAYIVDKGTNGNLYRRTSFGWAAGPKLPTTNQPMYDIAVTSAGDFWVVGAGGSVYHYPEP